MIAPEQLDEMVRLMAGGEATVDRMAGLRRLFPEIHFTHCSDDDVIGATPVREQDRFNLYLVDSSNHCFGFTCDPTLASGVVVAEIGTDD